MHIWTSPTDLTEDTYYDTREKMKAILCPTLIKLAPCIDVQFSLKLETDWKPDLLCREKSWAEPEVLLPPLEGGAEDTSLFPCYSFYQPRSPERTVGPFTCSQKDDSPQILFFLSEVLFPSLLWSCQHPLFFRRAPITSIPHAGCWGRHHLPTSQHTPTCCP